jgi:lecithin-cholesterol acyltransferase
MKSIMKISAAIALLMALMSGGGAAAAQETAIQSQTKRTPVVVFPAFHFTRLKVTVKDQTAAPGCPKSGVFEDWFLNDVASDFDQVCQDKLLTLVYDGDLSKPMPERFSNQPGVTVEIKSYGKTESAPFYEKLYTTLEAAGYERDKSIRVAGYDSRLTPDMGGFLARTVALIEETYRDNKNTPVHLVGHSNGPLYAQYLLTHTSQAWKDKYIHGFTPFAGNWPGQGLLYAVLFGGLNTVDLVPPATPENALSSALMYQSHPSSYMSAADPAIFGDQEVVVQTVQGNRSYMPLDYPELFADAGLTLAQELADYYIGFVKFADPAHFPNVDVYAEKGSGIPTAVGAVFQDLTVGQVIDLNTLITRLGDVNQEDITNDSITVWEDMSCFRFELVDRPGVNHFELVENDDALQRLLANLQRPKSVCP